MSSEEEKKAIDWLKNTSLDPVLEYENDIKSISIVLNLIEKQQKEIEDLKDNNIKYRKALLYMLNQFAYDEKRNKEEDEPLFTGGLGALEEAFDVLNIKEGISRKELWKMIQELLEE